MLNIRNCIPTNLILNFQIHTPISSGTSSDTAQILIITYQHAVGKWKETRLLLLDFGPWTLPKQIQDICLPFTLLVDPLRRTQEQTSLFSKG